MTRTRLLLITIYYLLFTLLTISYADTIKTNEGREIKGIVVEDYKDRVIFSTVNGEKMIMKSDMKELSYDNDEENLIKLAEQAKEKRDYVRALTYYDMAFKANPYSKAAKDGLVFLEGYLFRKEQARKEDDVKKRGDIESQGISSVIEPAGGGGIAEKTAKLNKGLGITLAMEGSFPVVENLQPHSAADEAEIKKGDRIFAIWSRLTGYMELDDVMDALLDKPSLELKCTIERTVDVPLGEYRLISPGPDEIMGASFSMEFDGLTIASVRDNSPAKKAGLKKGDLVVSIDGKQTRYMPLKKAIDEMRRSKSDVVRLTIRREALIWRRD